MYQKVCQTLACFHKIKKKARTTKKRRVLTSRMKITAVARILSCMHNVDTEKNAETHRRMFFKSA